MAYLASKGLSLEEIIEAARLIERKKDPTNAERQARYRERRKQGKVTRYSNGVTPPIERDHTPQPDISPDGENQDTFVRAGNGCPPDVEPETYQAFAAIRRKRRSPITPQVMAGMRKEAGKAGWSLQDALAEAVLRGWQSFKAEWVENNGRNTSTTQAGGNLAAPSGRPMGRTEAAARAAAGMASTGKPGGDHAGPSALPDHRRAIGYVPG
jgi:hypothetical protein